MEAAQSALLDAEGDVPRATRLFAERVRRSREMRDALTEPLINGACYDLIRRVCIKERRKIWLTPDLTAREGKPVGHDVHHLAAGNLLQFPLPGGQPLGDATREEIAEAAGFYARQAADMAWKGRWLDRIALAMPPGKRARQVFDDRKLRLLQEETRNAA